MPVHNCIFNAIIAMNSFSCHSFFFKIVPWFMFSWFIKSMNILFIEILDINDKKQENLLLLNLVSRERGVGKG